MTLISSIISDAYRESNMLPLGKVPTADQVTEALHLYNQLIDGIYGGDAGEPLEDWPLGTFDRDQNDIGYEIPFTDERLHHPSVDRRLIALNAAATTVYFPVLPQDGARMGIADPYSRLSAYPITLNGNGRPIEGVATLLLNVDATFREWFYRADLAAWVRITDLVAADENPFPKMFDAMFEIMLAMRLNPRYGRQLDPQSVETLKHNRRQFIARYLQSRPLQADDSISWPFMSRQGYVTQGGFSSQRAFARGNY